MLTDYLQNAQLAVLVVRQIDCGQRPRTITRLENLAGQGIRQWCQIDMALMHNKLWPWNRRCRV
jgi:hypothetical protein